jgi:hypothetical protein
MSLFQEVPIESTYPPHNRNACSPHLASCFITPDNTRQRLLGGCAARTRKPGKRCSDCAWRKVGAFPPNTFTVDEVYKSGSPLLCINLDRPLTSSFWCPNVFLSKTLGQLANLAWHVSQLQQQPALTCCSVSLSCSNICNSHSRATRGSCTGTAKTIWRASSFSPNTQQNI